MGELYLGVMSGTSQDGVDVALVEFDAATHRLHRAATTPYPDTLRRRIAALLGDARTPLRELGEVDAALGRFFAQCVVRLLEASAFEARDITAIGHSGHTVFHKPQTPDAFTMQIGDPSTVAAHTGITTVGHLRHMDIALGGQGAPLAPAFHAWCFSDPTESRVTVNIGGIANICVLHPQRPVLGFDTGPGNTLLDNWSRRCTGRPFDRDGAWSRTGRVVEPLLQALKADGYFKRAAPKSTGIEHFNLGWLEQALARLARPPAEADVQATLTQLTAATIAEGIDSTHAAPQRIILCGGGALNAALTERLSRLLPQAQLQSSAAYGIDPQWVEAMLFAWLARARLRGEPGNVPTVTGARRAAPLGGVYCSVSRQ